MDPVEHLRIAWHRRWIVAAVAFACAGSVYGVVAASPTRFIARSVVSLSIVQPGRGQYDTNTIAYLSQSYAALAVTRPVLARATTQAGPEISPAEAARKVSSASPNSDGFITITASGASSDAARTLAQGVADALVALGSGQQAVDASSDLGKLNGEVAVLSGELPTGTAGAPLRAVVTQTYDAPIAAVVQGQTQANSPLTLVSAATPSDIRRPAARYALLALLAGLVLATEGAVVETALSGRLATEDFEAGIVSDLPILAIIPRRRRRQDKALAEAFRTLRSRLTPLLDEGGASTVAVTAILPKTGATFTSVRLSEALADLPRPVLLADADLRCPGVHEVFGIDLAPGLSDVLSGDGLPNDRVVSAISRDPSRGVLAVLPAGGRSSDPCALLSLNLRPKVLLGSSHADVVIFDTAPATLYADALAVAAQCDVTILVANYRSYPRRLVAEVVRKLDLVGANVVGVVVTKAPAPRRRATRPASRRDRQGVNPGPSPRVSAKRGGAHMRRDH